MLRALKRLLAFLGLWRGSQPPGAAGDPYAWRPVPHRPRPKARSGAVALEEPDDSVRSLCAVASALRVGTRAESDA